MNRIHRSLILFTAWSALLLAAAMPATVGAQTPSSNVPLGSWIYPALDRLAARGLIPSALQGIRPFSRQEAARQIAEARGGLEQRQETPLERELLQRLQEEFAEELVAADGNARWHLRPMRTFSLRYVYQDGAPTVIADRVAGGAQSMIAARQFSLNSNNDGVDYRQGSNGQASLFTEAGAGPLLLTWRPLLLIGGDSGASEVVDFQTLEGGAAIGLGKLELFAGRQSLWWGQGRHGSLVLTNNARPLDMLRLHNPSPVRLPWILSALGPFQFDAFYSRLEDTRVVPRPHFAGLRLDFKPTSWLELGAMRTVIFGGEGRPKVDIDDFFAILTGTNRSDNVDNSNQIAALDARLRLPFLGGAELYHEWGGEDAAGGFLADMARLYGLYLPEVEPTGRVSLRFEFADLSNADSASPAWYRHGVYRSGYTYKGKILGHHVGGGARDYFAGLKAILPCRLILDLSFDYEDRGFDQLVHERHLQPAAGLEWQLNGNLDLLLDYRVDRIANFGFFPGDDRTLHLVTAGLSGHL